MALLTGCANVPADYKFDETKAKGVVIGSVTFESGMGRYYLVVQPVAGGNNIDLGFGCAVWPCIDPAEDEAFPKRGGPYAVELDEGRYRIVGWRISRGPRKTRSSEKVDIEFDVERNKTTYLGNLHFDPHWEDVQLRDASEIDIPIIKMRYPFVQNSPIRISIAPGTEIHKVGGEYRNIFTMPIYIFVPR